MSNKEIQPIEGNAAPAKQTRRRPDLKTGEQSEAGDNAKFLRHARLLANLPAIDISNAEAVQTRIETYFDLCEEQDLRCTVSGMAAALGVSRDTIHTWLRGEFRKDTHSAVIRKAYSQIEDVLTSLFIAGKINPVSGIFLLKNWANYTDKQEHIITPNTGKLGDHEDIEIIRQRYLAEGADEFDD